MKREFEKEEFLKWLAQMMVYKTVLKDRPKVKLERKDIESDRKISAKELHDELEKLSYYWDYKEWHE